MESVLIYAGKMMLCSGVMFLYYQLFLKEKTFHHYNRFYLLLTMVFSVFLPLLKVDYFTLEINNSIYLLYSKLENFNSTKTLDNDFNYSGLIVLAGGLVSVFFIGKFLYGIGQIHQLKKRYQHENLNGISFYQTNLSEAPFSFFRNLFWKDTILLHSDLGKQILKHEMVHIEQKHSVDKIIAEIMVSVFWFNPFFHLIKKEISLLHEYLADKKSLKNGDIKEFAQMLLANSFSGKVLSATSPFLSSNLKKRLNMVKKPQTKYGYVRRIMLLPIVFIISFVYMVSCDKKGNIRQEKNMITVISAENNAKKTNTNIFDIEAELENASDKALYIINCERVNRQKFLDYKKHHSNAAIAYKGKNMNDDNHLVFGEIEKRYGVFQIIRMDGLSDNEIKKYHQLIKEINPIWYYDQIVNHKYDMKKTVEAKLLN